MRKKIIPTEVVRRKRVRKLLKKSAPLFRNRLLIKRKKRIKTSMDNCGVNVVELDSALICNEFLSANAAFGKAISKPAKGCAQVKIPSKFDVFRNPERVVRTMVDISFKLMSPRVNEVFIDHRRAVDSSLGSESLLGLLVTEIVSNRRRQLNEQIDVEGFFPKKSGSYKTLIKNIGIVRELSDDHFKDAEDNKHGKKIHIYRKDNKYAENASAKGDIKTATADECVEYLNACLLSHKLEITKDAKDKMKACLGEVFDNAEEHCNRNKPVWFVRGYFNDVEKARFLELSVFNLGNSIFDNFDELPDSSASKKKALDYVNRHRHVIDEESLFTVAALQGAVSTKGDEDPTRGHGSVTLIETFEALYDEYKNLRCCNSYVTNAEMNIISGETIISFDGSYRSKTSDDAHGRERFVMPFNVSQSLMNPPDSRYVSKMNGVKFPGVMINIRIPLQGSVIPL